MIGLQQPASPGGGGALPATAHTPGLPQASGTTVNRCWVKGTLPAPTKISLLCCHHHQEREGSCGLPVNHGPHAGLEVASGRC